MANPSSAEAGIARLDPLLGRWKIRGRSLDSPFDNIRGEMSATRRPAELFHVQRGAFRVDQVEIAFLEVVWYDPKTRSLRAHVYGRRGAPLRYTWRVHASSFTHSGLGFRSVARLSPDGRVLTGSWRAIRPSPARRSREYDFVQTLVS